MKKLIILSLLVFAFQGIQAQESDTVTIKREGSWGVNFANVGLSNWAAGGENSIALGTVFNTKVTRLQGKSQWVNQVDFALGGAKVGEQGFRKTDDAVILISRYTSEINDKLGWGFGGIFRTQLLEGNTFANDAMGNEVATKISNFMAPGYLTINLGLDYEPNEIFQMSFSLASGKFTFVSDDELAAAGAFGVDPGSNSRVEFGTNLLASLDIPIMENINFQSTLNFFTGYSTFGEIDTNWETLLVMKVNKWFNATFGTQLIYDKDILIDTGDGVPTDAVQFKHVLNFGLNFKLYDSAAN